MSAIEIAVKQSRKLESLLEQQFGASGKGLHEKVSSVSGRLSADLVKRIRWIATIRNNLVHEDSFELAPDKLADFQAACAEVERQLTVIAGPRRGTVSAQAAAPKKKVSLWVWVALVPIAYGFYYDFSPLLSFIPRNSPAPTQAKTKIAIPVPAQPVAKPDKVDNLLDQAGGKAATADDPIPTPPSNEVVVGPPSLPIEILSMEIGKDEFGSSQPTIKVRITNNTGKTVSSVTFGGELYLDGSTTSVTQSNDDSWDAFFGDHGLKNGEAQVISLNLNFFHKSKWTTPDILNAKMRRIRLTVLSANDGSRNPIVFKD